MITVVLHLQVHLSILGNGAASVTKLNGGTVVASELWQPNARAWYLGSAGIVIMVILKIKDAGGSEYLQLRREK
jgi:hypothetical protein